MNIEIDNSKEAAIDSKSWENPGSKFYDKICYDMNALKEAYLQVGEVHNDGRAKTSFSRSGCKYPHHSINKEGKLVLNIAGVKAAYSRVKQMGLFKGKIKEHLVKHYKELDIYNDSTMVSDEKINENFNFIESALGIEEDVESTYIESGESIEELEDWIYEASHNDVSEFMEKSQGKLKRCYIIGFDVNTGDEIAVQFTLEPENIVGISDKRLFGRGKNILYNSDYYRSLDNSIKERIAKIDKDEMFKKGLETAKRNIRKLGLVDFESNKGKVEKIFKKNGTQLQSCKLVPMFSDNVNDILEKISKSKKYNKLPTKEILESDVFKNEIKKLANNENNYEEYKIGTIEADKSYKTTKLLWDYDLFLSYKFSPVLRGYTTPGKGEDPETIKNYFLDNIYKDNDKDNTKDKTYEKESSFLCKTSDTSTFDDLYNLFESICSISSSWGSKCIDISYIVETYNYSFDPRSNEYNKDIEALYLETVFGNLEGELLEQYNSNILVEMNDLLYSDIMDESDKYIEERSHGKLKFDFRIGWDYNTGHQIKVVYSLNNINITDIGDFYYGKKVGVTKDSHMDYTKKHIRSKGNGDHQSKGQKVLKIIDLVTNKSLNQVTLLNPFCKGLNTRNKSQTKEDLEAARNYADNVNPSCKTILKVNTIDNSPSYKSTVFNKFDTTVGGKDHRFHHIATAEQEKNLRGWKGHNIQPDRLYIYDYDDPRGFTWYRNPNYKQALFELKVRAADSEDFIDALKRRSDVDTNPEVSKALRIEYNNLKIVKSDIAKLTDKNFNKSELQNVMKKYRESVDTDINEDLQYCYRVGINESTGEKVAIQFIADKPIDDINDMKSFRESYKALSVLSIFTESGELMNEVNLLPITSNKLLDSTSIVESYKVGFPGGEYKYKSQKLSWDINKIEFNDKKYEMLNDYMEERQLSFDNVNEFIDYLYDSCNNMIEEINRDISRYNKLGESLYEYDECPGFNFISDERFSLYHVIAENKLSLYSEILLLEFFEKYGNDNLTEYYPPLNMEAVFENYQKQHDKYEYESSSNEIKKIYKDNKDIEKIWFVKSDDGVDNCCIKVKGYDKPMRGRSAMLSIKEENDTMYTLCRYSNKEYEFPGGGWNKDEYSLDAAIRELHEETLTNARRVKRYGTLIEYNNRPKEWVRNHVNENEWWYGYYSIIYVGKYNGEFSGKIRKRDRETGFEWIKIDDVINKIPKEYKEALSSYINNHMSESYTFESKDTDGKNFLKSFIINTLSESSIDEFVNFIKEWNAGGFKDTGYWHHSKQQKIDSILINNILKELIDDKNEELSKKLIKCKNILQNQNILEYSDNFFTGISIGENVLTYYEYLKQISFNNRFYKNGQINVVRNALVECGFPAHTIEMLESSEYNFMKCVDEYLFYMECQYPGLMESKVLTESIDHKIEEFSNIMNIIGTQEDDGNRIYKYGMIVAPDYNLESMTLGSYTKDPLIINFRESDHECYDNELSLNTFMEDGEDDSSSNTEEFKGNQNEEPPSIDEVDKDDTSSEDVMDEPVNDEQSQEEEDSSTEEPSEEIQSEEEQPEDSNDEPSEEEPTEEVKEEPKSLPKQTDQKEVNKNGVRRKKLYIAFIEWCKEYNNKNTFGSIFDKDIFHNVYPFVPEPCRYFYRLANPILCVLAGDLTFFQVSELRKLNKDNKHLSDMMIFAATKEDLRVFNNKDKKVYKAFVDENNEIKLDKVLGNTFDTYIQTMIGKGDILNAPLEENE